MIDLHPLTVIFIMFGSLVIILATGLPVVFTMGSIGLVLIILLWGPNFAPIILVVNTFHVMTWYCLIAMPMFVFMAMILRSSGVAEDLFSCISLWLAKIPGGLAMAVVVASVFIAAMSGVISTGIVVLGIVAVPLMRKYGYSKEMAVGPVIAGAALACLIPPSSDFIIYGAIAQVSIGKLFIGGIIPGLILATMYIIYIGIRCLFNPELGPLPQEERVGLRDKFLSLKSLVLPGLLIIAVLGSIFMGICSATEASGVGAVGALVCAAIRRNLHWQHVKEACIQTLKVSSMVVWIIIGAYCFKSVFVLAEGPHFVSGWIAGLNIAPLGIIGIVQVAFVTLGCFVQQIVIFLVSLPVFLPVVDALGLSRLWFGVLMLTNLQIASLTPPFGFGLFYMRSVAPTEITLTDIIRSVLPFIPLQIICVLLVLFFPQLALWLPSLMLR